MSNIPIEDIFIRSAISSSASIRKLSISIDLFLSIKTKSQKLHVISLDITVAPQLGQVVSKTFFFCLNQLIYPKVQNLNCEFQF